ncbi:YhgE/Pip family protein [Demequina sp. NBRC 110052]|uniref:YhgE/Pip family protein n=1 Tax=Demequina sp. NBRC 110052 TaxID=1570341 RepID=UPI0013565C24|nr:YhgE/Pip family protein [Demequina sp. NBRC 110052]
MRLTRSTVLVALAAVALPAIGAAVLSWSVSDRTESLASVPVAIVNDDQIVTGETPMAAGRALSDALVHPDDGEETLDWTVTSASAAEQGLEDGTYLAVLTIPEDFSASVLSISSEDPEQAALTLETDPAASASTALISTALSTAAADTLGTQIAETVLTATYTGLGDLSLALTQAADGADQLADGADELAEGTAQVADGADALADGIATLADGADQVYGGAAALADGAAQAATGVEQLSDGAEALATGATSLASGSRGVSTGVAGSADGAGTLAQSLVDLAATCTASGASAQYCASIAGVAAGASELADGLGTLAGAADATASGASALAASTVQYADGADAAASGLDGLADGASQVAQGTASIADGLAASADGARQLTDGTAGIAEGASSLAEGSVALADGLAQGASQAPSYTEDQAAELASVVASPVALSASAESSGSGWAAAAILAIVLWLAPLTVWAPGRRADGAALLAAPATSRRVARALARPVVLLAAGQAVATVLVLALMGISMDAIVGVTLLSVLAGVTFALFAAGLRAALGRFALAAYALLTLVQVGTLTGVLPLESAPAPLAAVSGLMPATAFMNAAATLAGDPTGASVAGAAVCLLGWAVVGMALIRRRVALVRMPRALTARGPFTALTSDGRMTA